MEIGAQLTVIKTGSAIGVAGPAVALEASSLRSSRPC
jgi:hypothetical protein